VHKQLALVVLGGAVLAACSDSTNPSGPSRLAPVVDVSANVQTQLVPNEYIVVLRSQVGVLSAQVQSLAAASGAQVVAVYGAALNGFAVRANAEQIARIRSNPSVEYVEPVQIFQAIATQTPTPSWGLDRIDQRNLPLNNTFNYPTGGSAVHIYIIDTGILRTHTQFTGRIGNHFDAITGGGNANDCNGHGTHVAGTAGGSTYGIMKTATMHPVRVLNCSGSGSTTQVVNGINWVAANRILPAVSNMSLGGGVSTAIDNATNNMVAAGVTSPVAAGNSNANACNFSPARAANALTTGSTTSTDARSSFSNFGTCVDIFAPGSGIFSSYIGGNSATATLSGTSMASPHVAGAAALYLSFNPTHTPAQVRTALVNNATAGVLTGIGTGSPNLLLYTGFIGGAPPPPPPTNQNPVANFTFTCVPGPSVEFRCDFNGSSSSDPDGTVVAWNWTMSGKGPRTGQTARWGLPVGNYTVTLTVTDNSGGTNSKSQSFVVP
jgi:subtilisin family serine protease